MNVLFLSSAPHTRHRSAARALLLLLVCASLLSAHHVHGAKPSRPPNIVVFMADDLDVPTLQVALNANLMPNLQNHIISQANNFTNSFVTNSLCCPSRATFLTGQYTHNHGTLSNFTPTGGITKFNDTSTIATWLRDGGYHTGYVGKYLNGYGLLIDANRDGRVNSADQSYVPPGWDDWQALLDPGTYQVYGYGINDNGVRVNYGYTAQDYQTDVLARRAVDFIREATGRNKQSPIFLYISPLAPHDEINLFTPSSKYSDVWRWKIRPAPRHIGTVSATLPQLPSFNEADVSDKPQWARNWPLLTATDISNKQSKERSRLAAMRSFDDMIGSVVAELAATKRMDNTILIFTSDNGWHFGEHRLGGKMTAYEEAIRVPLYIRVPGATTSRAFEQFVLNNDLAPTIAEYAGVQPSLAVDGLSLIPLIADPSQPWRKRFLVEHYKAIEHIMEIPTFAAIRTAADDADTPNQLYVEYLDAAGAIEFYDLMSDPYQMGSLHSDPSPLREAQRITHAQRLDALKNCKNGTCQMLEAE